MKEGFVKMLSVMGGAALGVVVGAAVALLLAPRSGEETQLVIRQRVQEVVEAGRQAADTKRHELLSELEAQQEETV
jgi:gas vesicle protein